MGLDSRRIDSIVERVMRRLEDEGAVPGRKAPADDGPRVRPAARVHQRGPVFESVDEAASAARRAFLDLGDTTLETRDRMIAACRAAVEEHAPELSRLAVEETGLGRYEDKIKKNLLVGRKTPGTEVLVPDARSGDHGLTLQECAPYGVILSVTPSTNPSETVINNGIGMLAGGNATVFAPHPGAARVSQLTVSLLDQAVQAAGGPPNVFTTVATPSIQATQALMRHEKIRLLVVTGGGAVVQEAMSVGKRAITAGPGNPPVVVDTTADLDRAARGIYFGASFDNNVICTDEKAVIAVDRVQPDLVQRMTSHGAYELKGRELQLVKELVLTEDRGPRRKSKVNRDFIGKDAGVILEAAGISGPKDTRLLVAQVEDTHPFLWTEMMMPVIGVCAARDVDTAIDLAREIEGGCFHTASMYSRNIEKLSRMARICDCSIFIKNGPNYNGLGEGGEGFTSFTIASPTGEGMTTARSFTRFRRCALIDSFRIV
ncbi:MAG: aldehyde dehydrogenase EutE [Gemmatimonadetes bacterium]|nr:aldehyde dehydrogenase EutE [Gemmatimonadota bacterium]